MHSLDGSAVSGNTAQYVFARPVRDVLVQPQIRPLLSQQEFLVRRWKRERRLSKKQDLSLLQEFTISARPRLALFAAHPAGSLLVIFHQNPRQIRHEFLARATGQAWAVVCKQTLRLPKSIP